MGLNLNALLLPIKGTVYVGPVDTAPPSLSALATATPDAPPTGWSCFGYMSRDNLPEYSSDGGDVNPLDSWWQTGIDSVKDPETRSLVFNSLQCDAVTLGNAFPGGTLDTTAGTYDIGDSDPVSKAILIQQGRGTKWRGFYHPNCSLSHGDLPSLAVDAFTEIQISAQLLNSTSTSAAWKGKWFRIIDQALVSS